MYVYILKSLVYQERKRYCDQRPRPIRPEGLFDFVLCHSGLYLKCVLAQIAAHWTKASKGVCPNPSGNQKNFEQINRQVRVHAVEGPVIFEFWFKLFAVHGDEILSWTCFGVRISVSLETRMMDRPC